MWKGIPGNTTCGKVIRLSAAHSFLSDGVAEKRHMMDIPCFPRLVSQALWRPHAVTAFTNKTTSGPSLNGILRPYPVSLFLEIPAVAGLHPWISLTGRLEQAGSRRAERSPLMRPWLEPRPSISGRHHLRITSAIVGELRCNEGCRASKGSPVKRECTLKAIDFAGFSAHKPVPQGRT